MTARPIAFVEHGDLPVVTRWPMIRIPMDDFAGDPRIQRQVRVFIADPEDRVGYDREMDGYMVSWTPGQGAQVLLNWATLRDEPDWDTETQPSGTKNGLTLGWRWQWSPARNLTARWRWRRLWWDGGTDELCNRAWHFRVPGGSIAVFYKRPYRTREDGRCEECRDR